MPAATVAHTDEVGQAEGRTVNDEIAAIVAAAARLPAAERRELIEAIADTLARVPHGDHLDRLIQSDPAVMLGKPVIRGTRITVELILRKLGAGETMEQIIESHPRLTCEQIRAALAYAADSLARSVAIAESWDRNFEADVREGRLNSLAEEAIEDLREGRCTDLPGQPESPLRDDTAEPTWAIR
jgi:uncharacterized protein (DUF433 family)